MNIIEIREILSAALRMIEGERISANNILAAAMQAQQASNYLHQLYGGIKAKNNGKH